jgi:HEAT repeat protein
MGTLDLRINSNITHMAASHLVGVGEASACAEASAMRNRAKAAADNGNLSIAIDLLQHISIDQIAHNELVLDIALQVLIQGDFDQQWEIAKIISKLGDIAIQPLLDLLNDNDIDLEDRWVVARILGDFHQPQVVTALIELIQQQEDLELTEIATSALTKIGVPAISALTDLLATPDRHVAIATLAQIRHSRTIEPLIQVIDDADPQLRSLVVEALGSFHDPRIPPLLLAKLTDLNANVRKAAVTALCLRSDLAAELDLSQQLRPLLFDLNLAVCQATALGLARLPDLQNIEVLTAVLLSPQTPIELQSSVILALGWIGTKPTIDSLIAALPQAATSLAPEIVIAIGKTERDRVYASQILVHYLQTAVPSAAIIKQEIAMALGNLGNPDIVQDLSQLLNDPDDRVKLYAINAISKLQNN